MCSDRTMLSICLGIVLGIRYYVCYGPQQVDRGRLATYRVVAGNCRRTGGGLLR